MSTFIQIVSFCALILATGFARHQIFEVPYTEAHCSAALGFWFSSLVIFLATTEYAQTAWRWIAS